jgi:hypothetical protein
MNFLNYFRSLERILKRFEIKESLKTAMDLKRFQIIFSLLIVTLRVTMIHKCGLISTTLLTIIPYESSLLR